MMRRLVVGLCISVLLVVSHAVYALTPKTSPAQAGIATAHPAATEAAKQILAQGGNAFDAAVAATAALAVVEPYGSGIGGGGFWLLHRAKDGHEVMLDGREVAPQAAHRDMYLDDKGEVVPNASMNGALAAGIPGVPAALEHLATNYGQLPLKASLAPAIALARDGFPVDTHYQKYMGWRLDPVRDSVAARAIFLHEDEIPAEGYVLKQGDLAKTLALIASKGKAGFYEGEVAEKLVAGVKAKGGIWSLEDLRSYQVKERKPVYAHYKGMKITAAALPSSGGLVMSEVLNILSGYDLVKHSDVQRVHLITEAMRRAYRDRAEYMGDRDFVAVPDEKLTDAHYAAGLRASISPLRATLSSELKPTFEAKTEAQREKGANTTHFSIMDAEGNRVAATLSINYPFGSGFVPEGTGVLLNNEMDDFSIRPGTPNAYGLVGAAANAIEPGKRMLSSMTPTFLETDDRIALIGTPGGSRIITMVLLGALRFEAGESAQTIVDAPRFHHQYLPDQIQFEPDAVTDEVRTALRELGHGIDQKDSPWGNMQLVIRNKRTGQTEAASDRRGMGQRWVGTKHNLN